MAERSGQADRSRRTAGLKLTAKVPGSRRGWAAGPDLGLGAAPVAAAAGVGTAALVSRFRLASAIPQGTPRLPAGLPAGLMPWQRAGSRRDEPCDKPHLRASTGKGVAQLCRTMSL